MKVDQAFYIYISLEDWGLERSREHKVIMERRSEVKSPLKVGKKLGHLNGDTVGLLHVNVSNIELFYRVWSTLSFSFGFGPTPTCGYLLRTQQNTLLLRWFCWDCNQLVCLQRLSLDPISNLPIGDQTPSFPSKPTSCFLGFSDPNLWNTSSWLSWLPLNTIY